MYSDVSLLIDGVWRDSASGRTLDVVNPATGDVLGHLAHAGPADLDEALAATARGFAVWRATGAFERSKIMRRAADLLRERVDSIHRLMTLEQGKPLAEARMETLGAADTIDWFAEEARRSYGRVVPARQAGVTQVVSKEPVGPVAAFSPWNFPINQAVRKIAAALAAGCSIILKGPEETPASCAAMVRAFVDAGVPAGVLQLVFGTPAEISKHLIAHPTIRKITFTGSTAVGKQLAALAGSHMKRSTMELGGHAPALVFDDADLDQAAKILTANKLRNAGQVCVAPTRFLVQQAAYAPFLEKFTAQMQAARVGDGTQEGVTMGPLANARRVPAMEAFIADAVQRGAKVHSGGKRIGNKGYFFEPTILTDVPLDALVMNEEPFGPLAIVAPFDGFDDAMAEANRLPYGLASYAYTRSASTAAGVAAAIEAGMLGINHHGLALPETPFGGVKDSGYGSEGGSEAIESYLVTKFVSHLTT